MQNGKMNISLQNWSFVAFDIECAAIVFTDVLGTTENNDESKANSVLKKLFWYPMHYDSGKHSISFHKTENNDFL